MSAPDEDTVALVPLSELVALARLGLAMRKAQRDYFDRKRSQPHMPVTGDVWRAVRDLEKRFDAVALDALNRERQCLPGMGGAEGGAPA